MVSMRAGSITNNRNFREFNNRSAVVKCHDDLIEFLSREDIIGAAESDCGSTHCMFRIVPIGLETGAERVLDFNYVI
jgi:hypothetical protein